MEDIIQRTSSAWQIHKQGIFQTILLALAVTVIFLGYLLLIGIPNTAAHLANLR